LFELDADLAGQVFGGRDQVAGFRVVEYQRAELAAGVFLAGAEQAGDLAQPGLAAGVQADGQGIGGGVSAEPRGAGRDDPAAEDVRLRRTLPCRVELLQRVHQRGERVVAETALSRADLRQLLLTGLRVGPAGAPLREPVDGPEGIQVAVIPAPQIRAQLADLRCVLRRCRLGVQQGADGVAQPQQCLQFGSLAKAGRDGARRDRR
jgi:hypothetical protein